MLSKLQSVPRTSVSAESLTECELFLFSRPADFRFQAESSKMETPGLVFAGSLERVVSGCVHVCSHSIVFEPKDGRLPLCRIPIWKDFALQRTGVGDHQRSPSAFNLSNETSDTLPFASTCDVKIFINEAWELFETQSSIVHKWPAGTWVKLSVALDDASSFCEVARAACRIHCAMRSAWDIWMPLLVQHLNTLLQHRFSDAVDVSPVPLCDTSGCSSRDALANGFATGVCDFDQFFLGYRILPLIVEAVGMKIEAGRFISQPLHQEVHAGHVSIALDDVALVVPRAWRLRHTAFEIYVRVADVGQGSGLKLPNRFRLWQGFMFDVGSTKMRDACIERLKSVCPNMYTSSLQQATEEWEEQGMSNYEYLIFLNFMSGRTFNDLTQYPVMPWTRIDFEPRNKLAPGSPKGSVSPIASDGNSAPSRRAEVFRSFRDLSKNVGALSAQLLAKAKERLLDMREGEPRFLFGSHFSTPMYVVYFLVRIYPKFMMRFTSGTFDLPDRLFHSVADTWKGVVNNPSDQKELIPEFYDSDGSFLCNTLRVDLGTRHGGVNMLATQDSDSDTSYEDDPESMAEIAAMGAALLRKNLRKEDVVDKSYHRFAFSDSGMAPDWFQAEERRCNRFTMPLTKEEIGAAKSQFNSINARTIKKVAEATARKRMRAKKAMEKAKAKANSIAESDEMGVKAKQRSIEKLYLKAQGKMKPEEKKVSKRGNTLQKGSKNQPRISKGGGKNLDGRLKKDKKNTNQKTKRDKIGGAKTGRVARIRAIRGKSGKK